MYAIRSYYVFMTITNSNFDDDALKAQIKAGVELRDKLKKICEEKNPKGLMKLFKRKKECSCEEDKFSKLLDPASDFADEKKLFGELADKSGVITSYSIHYTKLYEVMPFP